MKAKKFKLKRFLIFLFIIYAVVTLANQQMHIMKLKTEEKAAIARNQKIINENEKLKRIINNAGSDESIEKMAREQLGMIKSNETVYINQNEAGDDVQKVQQ